MTGAARAAFEALVARLEANAGRAEPPRVDPSRTRPPIVPLPSVVRRHGTQGDPAAPQTTGHETPAHVSSVPESAFADPREVVVDARTGVPRQAGATTPEGRFVVAFRRRAERSLFLFARGVMGRGYLTKQLHKPECDWLQTCPPRRKLVLWPREHCKTTVVGHCLPLHILIQPRAENIYWPGIKGSEQRILLSGESLERAQDTLRVIQSAAENNVKLRALWPGLLWDAPRRESKAWNDSELIFRRDEEYPDPSIRAIGVGGAITGAHPTVVIEDDITTLKAANSPAEMEAAIRWHTASRALINNDYALNFILGTRWAVHDLYSFIQQHDPTTEIRRRAVIESGRPIYPKDDLAPRWRGQGFDAEKIADKRREHGTMFPLLFMNEAADPSLVDFVLTDLREYGFDVASRDLVFEEDDRDIRLARKLNAPAPTPAVDEMNGRRISEVYDVLAKRGEYLRSVRSA